MGKPIEQQIAELTPEQKSNMGKLYKRYVATLMAIVLVGVIVAGSLFFVFNAREQAARETYEQIGTFDFGRTQEKYEAFDECLKMGKLKWMAVSASSFVVVVAVVVLYLVYKKKYPYFSEKRYTYLRKLEKNQIK